MLDDKNVKLSIDKIRAFAHVAHVPVTLYDSDNQPVWECYSEMKLCSVYPSKDACCSQCPRKLELAKQTAINIEEPYIFLCEAELINIAYPLRVANTFKGTFFVGPVPMGNNKYDMVNKLLSKLSPIDEYGPGLLLHLEKTTIRTPKETQDLYDVFCNCVFTNRLVQSADDQQLQKLVYETKSGNVDDALASFRNIYDKYYLLNVGNLNKIKVNLNEMFVSLIGNLSVETALTVDYETAMKEIVNAFSFVDIYKQAEALIKELIAADSSLMYSGKSAIVNSAVEFVNKNYSGEISLKSVAANIHTTASYLSTLFKKEMGVTFSQYLTQLRLEQSVRLLKETHLSIIDVSSLCGFSTQSYFIKLFKERYKITPNEYRKAAR